MKARLPVIQPGATGRSPAWSCKNRPGRRVCAAILQFLTIEAPDRQSDKQQHIQRHGDNGDKPIRGQGFSLYRRRRQIRQHLWRQQRRPRYEAAEGLPQIHQAGPEIVSAIPSTCPLASKKASSINKSLTFAIYALTGGSRESGSPLPAFWRQAIGRYLHSAHCIRPSRLPQMIEPTLPLSYRRRLKRR